MTRPKAIVHKHRLALVAAFFSLVAFAPAHAEDFTFSIAPQDLSAALKLFAVQSHREIFFAPEVARGKRSKGIKGTVDDIKALKAILEGTGLNFSVTASNAILVNDPSIKRGSSQAGASTASGSAPPDTGNPTGLAQSNTANSQSGPDQNAQNAQSVPSNSATPDAGIPEILVKGSRIMNVDVTRTEDDVQPYYIFNAQQIEQSGATNIDQFLQQQVTQNTTYQLNGNMPLGNNTSSINLRGLGTNETLILIDGRRSANVTYNGIAIQPDLNGIPLAAIERIEVLPTSASAIYGGAAVGGVVNVILKKDFQGGEVRYTYDNIMGGGSAPQRTVNATYGFSLPDGTRVMLTGEYSDGDVLELKDRQNLFQQGIADITSNDPSWLFSPGFPRWGAATNILGLDANFNPTNLVLRNGTSLNSPITYVPSGSKPGSNISAGLLSNSGRYNLNLPPGVGPFGLESSLAQIPTTKSFMATVRRAVTSDVELFTEFSTLSNASESFQNPIVEGYVPSTAPDNPFKQGVLTTFPSSLATPYASDSVTQSVTVGALAHLPAKWNSELDYTWSRNLFENSQFLEDSTAFSGALASGAINPFVDTIAYPLNLRPYLFPNSNNGNNTLNDVALRASGPTGSLPGGDATLAVGLEHRKEGYHDSNNISLLPLDPAQDSNFLFYGQSQDVNSIYLESLLPFIGTRNAVPLVHSVEAQLAFRVERYTVYANGIGQTILPAGIPAPTQEPSTISYSSSNPTLGLKYAPVEELTARASYSKAFLPPTALQLLPNPTVYPQSAQITDPKNGETYLVGTELGGNPGLQPQTSVSWNFGLIWEPQEFSLSGLRVNLEYYKIKQPNYITTPPAQYVVDDPALAGRVTRDPTTGLITVINESSINATSYQTEGWDAALDYSKSTNLGKFTIHSGATLVTHDLRQLGIGMPASEFAGFPGDGGEVKDKINATVTWEYRNWLLGWMATYVGSYYQVGSPGDPFYVTNYYTSAQGSNSVPSQTYHTLFGSYNSKKTKFRALSDVTLQFEIKNVLDKLPPLDVYNQPLYYSPLGSPYLRDYRLTIKKAF